MPRGGELSEEEIEEPAPPSGLADGAPSVDPVEIIECEGEVLRGGESSDSKEEELAPTDLGDTDEGPALGGEPALDGEGVAEPSKPSTLGALELVLSPYAQHFAHTGAHEGALPTHKHALRATRGVLDPQVHDPPSLPHHTQLVPPRRVLRMQS